MNTSNLGLIESVELSSILFLLLFLLLLLLHLSPLLPLSQETPLMELILYFVCRNQRAARRSS